MGNGLDRFDWFVAHVVAGTLDEDAVREGFAPSFLDAVPTDVLVQTAAGLQELLADADAARRDHGDAFEVVFASHVAAGAVETDAPHRFIGLRFSQAPAAAPLQDARVENAPLVAEGNAPVDALREVFTNRGLVGVVAAAFREDGNTADWRAAVGYANLEDATPCALDTRMLAGSISKLLVANLALQLVAAGKVDLDAPANDYLTSLRLANDAVTVRHLLTHTGGVSSAFDHYAAVAPPPAQLLGDVVAVDFEPGTQRVYSNGGYAVLGEAIASVTGTPIVDALHARVLEPLGMHDSSFATHWPDDVGPGYEDRDGRATPMPQVVPSVPAAGGLVTTTRDLGRFVAGWRSLLPDGLATQAVSAQVDIPAGGQQGFGWLVGNGVVGHAGGTITYSSSLLWWTDGTVKVLITNRQADAQGISLALQA